MWSATLQFALRILNKNKLSFGGINDILFIHKCISVVCGLSSRHGIHDVQSELFE